MLPLFTDPPSAPRGLKAAGTGPGAIAVQWDEPELDGGSPITTYIIEIRLATGTTWTRVTEVDPATKPYRYSYHFWCFGSCLILILRTMSVCMIIMKPRLFRTFQMVYTFLCEFLMCIYNSIYVD